MNLAELKEMEPRELVRIARSLEVEGASAMTKPELIHEITAARNYRAWVRDSHDIAMPQPG